jgi:organic radical activating enzyme
MVIQYKIIEHERFEDAPFIGCLISSIDCHINCKNCFNQHLKLYPTITKDSKEIIKEIKSDPFDEGIILAGLEWTDQPFEMTELIEVALKNKLKVMLYTGLSEEEFKNKFPYICNLKIYIKFGKYDEENASPNNFQYGVKLATKNQKIKGD